MCALWRESARWIQFKFAKGPLLVPLICIVLTHAASGAVLLGPMRQGRWQRRSRPTLGWKHSSERPCLERICNREGGDDHLTRIDHDGKERKQEINLPVCVDWREGFNYKGLLVPLICIWSSPMQPRQQRHGGRWGTGAGRGAEEQHDAEGARVSGRIWREHATERAGMIGCLALIMTGKRECKKLIYLSVWIGEKDPITRGCWCL